MGLNINQCKCQLLNIGMYGTISLSWMGQDKYLWTINIAIGPQQTFTGTTVTVSNGAKYRFVGTNETVSNGPKHRFAYETICPVRMCLSKFKHTSVNFTHL